MQALFPCDVSEPTAIDSMAVTESRFHKLETRVNEIGERVAELRGANTVPHKSHNAFLITILSILGVAIVSYWGWIGTQVVAQGRTIDILIAQTDPTKALNDISQLDQKKFAKALPIYKK